MKVIIADDSEGNISFLERILAKVQNIEIIGKAKNGEEELELIRKLKPDVVLTDNDMPKYKGIEVIEIIKNENNDSTPIFIMISGDMGSELMIKMRELKVDSFIRKPIDEKRLIEELEAIIKEDEIPKTTFQNKKKQSIIEKILSKFK